MRDVLAICICSSHIFTECAKGVLKSMQEGENMTTNNIS